MPRDVQDDKIIADGYGSGDSLIISEAIADLWNHFCADTTAWPVRTESRA